MTEPQPDDNDPLLGLVRGHLLAESTDIDATQLYERLRGRVRPAATTARWQRSAASVLAVAVAIAIGFVGGMSFSPGPVRASAEVLVQEAQAVHAQPLDRSYLVESRPEPGFAENYPLLAQPRVSRLWTRGDRFWVESTEANRQWAWGRDDEGNFWMTVGRNRGVRFELKELPLPLAAACEVYSMKIESLLIDVLRHFELSREPGEDAGTVVIRASPRPGRPVPGLRGATLTLDAETKVIRKAELYRMVMGRPAATVTFTLSDSRAQGDEQYTPEGHLIAPFEMFTAASDPQKRAELLRRFFPRMLDGPLPPPKGLPKSKGFEKG
ncbi:MAG: hypothetical protein U0746_01945 [Gemmataceae bacterium]